MIAAIIAERFRRKRHVFYSAAVLVALSRVYLGVHYPGDVIAGACLGLAVTRLLLNFRPHSPSVASFWRHRMRMPRP